MRTGSTEESTMIVRPATPLAHAARRLAAAGAVACAALAVAACGSTGSGTGSGPTVSAKEYAFTPSEVPVGAGQQVTVTLKNDGTTEHSLTLDNGGGETEAQAGKSATLSVTAPQSGTLSFHCKYHPTQMKGSFTVGGGGGSSQTAAPSQSTGSGYGY
jgi:plastocyanin